MTHQTPAESALATVELNLKHAPESMLDFFAVQVRKCGTAVAVECGDHALTYSELDRLSNQLAHYLCRMGVGPEVRVGIWLPRSLDLIVALYAILKAGGTYVPLDMSYPQQRIAYMLEDSQAPVLLTLQAFQEDLQEYAGKRVLLDAEKEDIARESEKQPAVSTSGENLAYLIYTSGSTGRPKAVAVRHHSVVVLLHWAREVFTDEELSGVLASTSICFDMSVFEIFGPLSWGGRTMVVNNALDISGIASAKQVTLIDTVPSAIAELMRMGAVSDSVRTINLGGEALPTALVRQVYQLKNVQRVYNLYGPSEDTTFSSYEFVRKDEQAAIAPVGIPVRNTEFHVLDGEMQPLPSGAVGELYIGGDGLARGYLNRPELTAERFVPDPVSGRRGTRLYYTGDRVRQLPDGRFEYLGRIDHQIKIRGYRVELGEIESILKDYQGIKQAVVLALENGTGSKKLVAYVVGEFRNKSASTELCDYLQQKLPDYMVPAQFVFLERLPLTPNGKIDRHALPAPENTEAGVAAQTELEEAVTRACCEVLGVPEVSMNCTFMQMGGSSLNATRAIAAIRKATSVWLPIRMLFENKTLQEIAREIEALRSSVKSTGLELKRRPVRKERYPAAYSQERIWFIQRMDPLTLAYHFNTRIRFIGAFNKTALGTALTRFVERHEIYRTTLEEIDGELVQIVHAPWKVELEEADAENDPGLVEQIFAESQKAFDLTSLPLARWKLIRMGRQEHVLLVVEHHVIHDGWSFNVFLQEITELYRSHDLGGIPNINPFPLQFGDYAQWQREWTETDEARNQLEYWAKVLAGVPSLLSLPYDHGRPAVQSYEGGLLRFHIGKELESKLHAATRRSQLTLFMLFTTALEVLLHRYSHQEDFCIGTGIANRRWAETKDLTGMLVNNIPLRARISGNLSIAEVAEGVRKTTLEAYANQDVPFDKIVEAINPVRDPRYNPVFQVMLGFHDSPLKCAELAQTSLIVEQALANGSAKFDLNVIVIPPQNHNLPRNYKPERELLWEYNSALFDDPTAQQMLRHFIRVLEEISRNLAQKVSEVPLLDEAERQQLLSDWNQTIRPYPQQSVHRLFEEEAEKTPEALAVTYDGKSLTYAELNQQANQLARYLKKLGAHPESFVGILLERKPQMVIALLAVLKAGAAYVPLDYSYPPARLRFMIEDAGVEILISEQELSAEILDRQSRLKLVNLQAEQPGITDESSANLDCLITNRHLAYAMYTSGSTGTPKGIAIEHGNIVRLVKETDYVRLGASDRVAQVANASFDAITFEIWGALLNGGCLTGIDQHTALNPLELSRKINNEKISAMFLTTALFNQIAREAKGAFADLHYLFFGGEAVDPHCVRSVLEEGPPKQFTHVYGPTEATTFSTWFVIHSAREGASTVPIGRPLANAQLYVLDEWLQPVPLGVTGELFIGGYGIGRGYLNRPELTAEKFVPHPFTENEGQRLYRTGDLVRQLRDGNLEFVGRVDHQVKIRGFRVEIGEIEAALGQMERVRQCVVVLRQDDPGEKKLVVYFVPESGATLNPSEMRRYLKSKLPEYMVPGAYVQMPELPLTVNGKVDRQALPAPQYRGEAYRAPRTPQEEMLCEIFADILSIERVGIDDSFFDLGGHSLMAMRMVSRIHSILGAELTLRTFFESSTVAGIASLLHSVERHGPPLVRQERPEHLPLSYAQQRLWFIDQLQGTSTEYNMLDVLRLRGELDRHALEQAVNAIVQRHEVLRTRLLEVEGRAVQVIVPEMRIRLLLEDLSGFSRAAQEQRLEAAMWQEREQPFDLTRGPLLRLKLLRLGEGEHVLLRTFHHIVFDGWSQGIFNWELSQLYGAMRAGLGDPLPPLGLQYGDFTLWQRQWLDEERVGRELGYWKEELAGIAGQLELPKDRARPARQTFTGLLQRGVLEGEGVAGVKRVGREGRATLYMVLLGAWAVLLERYSGQEEIVVGTPIANRQEAQLEGLIGFFVNSLVLRVEVKEGESFRELLGEVREKALGAYAHQDLPFERLVEELSPQRSLNTTPIYQVLFALQNASIEMPKLPGLEVESIKSNKLTVRFDLEVHAWERDGHIEFDWIYNPDLFDSWRIEQMAHHYIRLLEQVPGFIDRQIADMELLGESEKFQILLEWSGRETMHPAEATIDGFFEQQVRRTPDAIAVLDRYQILTYRELYRKAEQFACRLRTLGVRPEVKVGICMKRSAEMLAALLGILKAGGAYVPLDPEYPPDRLLFMLQDSQASILLTEEELLPRLPAFNRAVLTAEQIQRESQNENCVHHADALTSENLAYLIYTSGSTGTPKGVAITHGSAVTLLEWARHTFKPEELAGVLASTSICFDLSVFEIFVPLSWGGAVLLVQNALELAGTSFSQPLTLINTVPSVIRELLRLDAIPASVKTVNLAGEPLPAELVAEIHQMGHIERIFNLYGPTEDTTYSTYVCLEGTPKRHAIPIGAPIASTRVYVLNEQLKPVPVGVAGELYLGGAGLARGYWGRPDLTAEHFVPDLFADAPGNRLYRTGDLVRWRTDGLLEFLGRTDHQAKIRGFRIEPAEIESALRKCEGVQDALVMVREDLSGSKQLVGYVVCREAMTLDGNELRIHLRSSLPEYMVPAAIVVLAAWPLTQNRKIDRRALPAPDQQSEQYRAPRTQEEEILCQLFAEVLEMDHVGIDDNFFSLGGHSLMATLLVSRIRATLGINLPVQSIFETPTIAGLSHSLALAPQQILDEADYVDPSAVQRN